MSKEPQNGGFATEISGTIIFFFFFLQKNHC